MSVARMTGLIVAGLVVIGAGAAAGRAEILIGSPDVLSGPYAWLGEQHAEGIKRAVEDINGAGGVLGETLALITVDVHDDPEQAVAAAHKLVSDGVVFVEGPNASEAAIATAPIFEEAGVIMILGSASNPRVTESGWRNVFRVFGRDDRQGAVAADYLAKRWAGQKIAILHDGTVYGHGLADETKKNLNARGIQEHFYRQYDPKRVDYSDLITELQAAAIDVAYVGGRTSKVGLIARQAGDRGYRLQVVSGDAIGSEEFQLVAGAAAEGTLFTSGPDPRAFPAAKEVVRRFRESGFEPENYTLYAYAAVQAWAQAVEMANTLDYEAVIESLHAHQFDTVLGRIGFDHKGDVTGYEPFVWYVWREGNYAPVDPAELID
jgi:branched-chain amino acid transport system substrate-binding protein